MLWRRSRWKQEEAAMYIGAENYWKNNRLRQIQFMKMMKVSAQDWSCSSLFPLPPLFLPIRLIQRAILQATSRSLTLNLVINRVVECTTQVWLDMTMNEDGNIRLLADKNPTPITMELFAKRGQFSKRLVEMGLF
ncbi:unnamed protein product [Lactuca saligna]|uniref:Uncharacterized protein n=1 Tax=Lactuca saligna TaxID=75948 RepID=A0AA36EHM4_LACSI|nr:unnamed protein product [Lactuca saligna]